MQVLYGCFRNPSGNSLKCCSAHVFVFSFCPKYIVRAKFHAFWWMNKQRKETQEVSRWNKESKSQAVGSSSSDIDRLLLAHTDFLTKALLVTTGQHPHLCAFCFPSGYFLSQSINIHLGNTFMLIYYMECKGSGLSVSLAHVSFPFLSPSPQQKCTMHFYSCKMLLNSLYFLAIIIRKIFVPLCQWSSHMEVNGKNLRCVWGYLFQKRNNLIFYILS